MTYPAAPSVSVRTVALLAIGVLAGCASTQRGRNGTADGPKPVDLQTLADLQPPLTLPIPATRPTDEASIDALEHYARGRDALVRNQKATAARELAAAVEADPYAAVAWRDLGYARVGVEDGKAIAAFRTARSLDPDDADSRLQLARLLLATRHGDEAVTELRLARLSPEFEDDNALAAVIDLLLAQSLEQAHYRTAALECYEHVLAVLQDDGYGLRGRPELAEVLGRPDLLMLRVADLAVQCGRGKRAIELYDRLRETEPQSARTLDARLARAYLAAGDKAEATRRAIDVVRQAHGSPLAVAQFDTLYAPLGGAAAALDAVRASTGVDADTRSLLTSHLLLDLGRTDEAVAAAGRLQTTTLPVVRQLVHAYRSAGRDDALLRELIRRTAAEPAKWPAIERGLDMLTHFGQNTPVTPEQILAANAGPQFDGARYFMAAQAYTTQGRPAAAKENLRRSTDAAGRSSPKPFDADAAGKAPALDLSDLDDVTSAEDLSVLIEDYRDDPELLTATVVEALRTLQRQLVLQAFAPTIKEWPGDPVLAVAYAQVLNADDRGEAYRVLEQAVAAATAAPPLYLLASQYSNIGDTKSAERVLRLAHDRYREFAPVCNDLGFLLADQGRDLGFAEQLLKTAVDREPDNAAYLDSFGWLLYKRGKFDDAAKLLESAVTVSSPSDPVVLDHAGDALYQSKQTGQSAERWQQAIDAIKQRGSSDPQLRLRVEQKLRQLKDKTPVVVAPVAKAQ